MVECFCIDHLDVCFKFTVLLCNQHQELMCFLFTACYMAGFLCPSVNYDVLKLKINGEWCYKKELFVQY